MMKMLPHITAVSRDLVSADIFDNCFKLFKEDIDQWNRFHGNLVDGPPFQLLPVLYWQSLQLSFYLFQPEVQLLQKGLHVGDDDLEFRQQLVDLLPLADERFEFTGNLAVVPDQHLRVHVRPARPVEHEDLRSEEHTSELQ